MKGDVVPREGSWALVILNLDSCLLCILPGQLERPGKHSNHYAEGFQTKQKKNLSKAYVCIFLSCKQKSVLCDYFKETWSRRGQLFTHSWLVSVALLCTNSLPQDSERNILEHVSHGFFSWKMLPPWEDPVALTSEE